MGEFDLIELREVCLSLPREKKRMEELLAGCGIRLDRLTYAAGLFDEEKMVACGGCDGGVIKCVAVDPACRGEALADRLISHLITKMRSEGIGKIKVFTKPENEEIFASFGFFSVGRAEKAILLESERDGVRRFASSLEKERGEGVNGAIVMNANPFSLGHRFLIEEAAKRCDCLHVFVVEEDRSVFPFRVRKTLVEEGTADLGNVKILDGGEYIISSSTFPSYFLKEYSEATRVHAELDLDLFARVIAPSAGITKRFVGEEPTDRVTAEYNAVMKEMLPRFGIEPIVIPRLAVDGEPVSASRVRKLFAEGKIEELRCLVPETTLGFLLSEEAKPIAEAIRKRIL